MASHTMPALGPPPPRSVEEIAQIAQDYEYNPLVPLRYWLRSAATLIREAHIYEQEGQEEQAYLLLFRHAQLVLVNLVRHPDAKDEKLRKILVEAEKEVENSLRKMEVLKPRINKRHRHYSKLIRESQSRKERSEANAISHHQGQLLDSALSNPPEFLEADKNKDLAVRLAQKEISRRDFARKAVRNARISPSEGRSRGRGRALEDWENIAEQDKGIGNDLDKRIREVRANISGITDYQQQTEIPSVQSSEAMPVDLAYRYPVIPRQSHPDTAIPPSHVSKQLDHAGNLRPPTVPPKRQHKDEPPSRPDKISAIPVPNAPGIVKPTVSVEASSDLDPSSFTFKPSAYLENGTPLRTVFLSPELRVRFLALAAPNTHRNLETCGILCGTLISNALFVSRLLIPEQKSTSDTCETVNESAIFDYCDSEDLMMLGWIHTHPTQTCFMSSRDLHTHCGYQVMLPESIAIVCAPSSSPDWGVFRLTDPPGLKTVLNCTQTGLFHPHAEHHIYTEALRPGHVFEVKGLEFETVDLRPGRS